MGGVRRRAVRAVARRPADQERRYRRRRLGRVLQPRRRVVRAHRRGAARRLPPDRGDRRRVEHAARGLPDVREAPRPAPKKAGITTCARAGAITRPRTSSGSFRPRPRSPRSCRPRSSCRSSSRPPAASWCSWVIGAVVGVTGVVGETIADAQLARWKREPANRGRVCDTGLWGWSRHPNYFFEWCVWIGYRDIWIRVRAVLGPGRDRRPGRDLPRRSGASPAFHRRRRRAIAQPRRRVSRLSSARVQKFVPVAAEGAAGERSRCR